MPGLISVTNAKSASLECVVRRADGTREEYGVVAFTHRNRLLAWLGQSRMRVFGLLGFVRVRVTRPGLSPRMEWRRIQIGA